MTSTSRIRALGLLALAPGLAAVSLLAPTPWTAVHVVRVALAGGVTSSSPDPTAPLLAAVALAAWACTGWLVLVVVLTWCDRLPGAAGRTARCASAVIAPAAVRAVVRTALGMSLAGSVMFGSTAFAADRIPTPVVGTASDSVAHSSDGPSLDWPTLEAPTLGRQSHGPDVSSPTSPRSVRRPPAPAARTTALEPAPQDVVVQPGDSLWSIAARALPADGTDRQVAQSWPQWWSANRSVIGADPDLIHPGTHLIPPART